MNKIKLIFYFFVIVGNSFSAEKESLEAQEKINSSLFTVKVKKDFSGKIFNGLKFASKFLPIPFLYLLKYGGIGSYRMGKKLFTSINNAFEPMSLFNPVKYFRKVFLLASLGLSTIPFIVSVIPAYFLTGFIFLGEGNEYYNVNEKYIATYIFDDYVVKKYSFISELGGSPLPICRLAVSGNGRQYNMGYIDNRFDKHLLRCRGLCLQDAFDKNMFREIIYILSVVHMPEIALKGELPITTRYIIKEEDINFDSIVIFDGEYSGDENDDRPTISFFPRKKDLPLFVIKKNEDFDTVMSELLKK